MDTMQILSERALGEKLPISVATALPFEALLESGYGNSQVVYINLHTLFRNLHGCIAAEAQNTLPAKDFIRGMVLEMRFLKDHVKEISRGLSEAVFYLPTYRTLQKEFPRANLRAANTDRQRAYKILNAAVLRPFIDNHKELEAETGLTVTKTEIGPPKDMKSAMVVTHHVVDLLSMPRDTILLESHTGLQKPWTRWNTKLLNGNQLVRIPFNRLTLQVFGDKTDFSPMASKVKAALLLLAEERQWGPQTTDERVAWSIRQLRDPFAQEIFLELLKA